MTRPADARTMAQELEDTRGLHSLTMPPLGSDGVETIVDGAGDAVRESEGRDAFLLRLVDALRPIADPVEIQEVASRLLAEHLGVARAVYAEVEDDEAMPAPGGIGATQRETPGRPTAFGDKLIDAYRRGETVAVDDVETDARITPAERTAHRAADVRAFLAVALVRTGRWVATFGPQSAAPRRWTASEVELTRDVAERTWATVERARAEGLLRRNEIRLRLALEATGMGSFVWYPAEDRTEPDARMLELFGLPADGRLALTTALERIIHPDDRAPYAAAVERALDPAGDRVLHEEIRAIMPDGSIRWVVVTGRVEGGTDGRSAPAMFGTAADITDYKRSQELLRSNEERQAFLLTLSDTLRALADPAAIAAAASRLLGVQLRAGRVYGGEVIDDIVLIQGDYAASGHPMDGQLRLSSWGQPVVETYRRGARLVVADVRVHPAFQGEDLSRYEAAGAVGAIVIPVRRSDSWGALFFVTSPVPRAWSDAEVELADEVAQRAWAATDGLRREEALRESETRFRLLVENITDYAIYRTNARGVITDWTEGAARVKGYAAHEVIGRHVSMFHAPDDVASGTVERVLEEAARLGRSEHETWKVRAGGERFWANEITTALHDATGRLVGFTRISRDLTAQRRIEAEREELLERERTRREAAEAFMAVMSHELKTPVTSIYSAASLLRKSPGRPDLTELVDDIEEEADRLLRIVDDLLVLSGVERGLILLAPEPILIHHTLSEVLGTVERRFPDVDFEVERSGPVPIVLANPTALRQIINNLLTNAAKYAGLDGPVRVETSVTDGSVVVSVLDRGPGLGSDPDALFTLFHRAPHTARLASGTGIGLYVARQLVVALNGTIGAEPRPDGGSRFWFALPVAPADETA